MLLYLNYNKAITSEVKNVDKYEYKVRSGEISNLINEEKYAEAVNIADTIDWRRVKSSTMLLKISALYRVNKRNEDSRGILLLAYERYPTNRSVVYSLCELSIELNDVVAAIEYYKQFAKIAPDDSGVYTLRYRILEAQEASLEERIEILEELKIKDYQEEWVYELAYLYHRVGLSTKCVEVCDELILWIGDGPYVMKAMELKALHVPLTEEQQAKYDFMLRNAQGNYSFAENENQEIQEETTNFQGEAEQGYYDEDGNYIAYEQEAEQGYYDEDGNYVAYEQETEQGYYDEDGNYIAYEQETEQGYYDEDGNYIAYEQETEQGYYDEDGNYIAYEQETEQGYYDENGNYVAYEQQEGEQGYYDEDGNYVAYEQYEQGENYPEGDSYQEDMGDEYENPIEQSEQYEQAPETQAPQQKPYNYDDVDMSQYNTINLQKVVAESMKELFPDDDIFAEEREKLNADTIVYDKIDTTTEDSDTMTELEKAVANELGGSTQNLPYEQIEEMTDTTDTESKLTESGLTENVLWEEDYDEEQYAEAATPNYQMEVETPTDEAENIEIHGVHSIEHIQKEVCKEFAVDKAPDPDEEKDIVETAKEDAIKTQEIKMNTAELSALSDKIVETTNKEATGAKREQIRDFTEDEQELFENFAVTKKIKKQIINAIENMSLAAYTGNVIITGEAGIDTIKMAKNLIKEFQAQDANFSGKIAKITGQKINGRNIKEIFDKIDNGGIIIEKANGMSEEKLYEMATLLNQEHLGIIVILEDTKKEMSKLLEKQAMIADYFNLRIDLMEMDNNALVAYAKNYALALQYAIDELGTLALYTRIANMQSGNHVVTKDEVREIIDEAIYKSKKPKIKNFVDVLLARRYDSEDMIVLKERDFI
jgi:hypothetical protein